MNSEIKDKIEKLRVELDDCLRKGEDFETAYHLSVALDKLINEYIELAESESQTNRTQFSTLTTI